MFNWSGPEGSSQGIISRYRGAVGSSPTHLHGFCMNANPSFYSDLHELIISDYLKVEKSSVFFELMREMENTKPLASANIFLMIRPRGFGLSLCTEALNCVLERTRDFTQGLRTDEEKERAENLPRHHVILINLKKVASRTPLEFKEQLLAMLQQLYWEHHLNSAISNYTTPKSYFAELITELSERHREKIVVLIDNYDSPFIMASAMEERYRPEALATYLEMLNVLKHARDRVQYAFLSGHIKFRLASELSEGLPLVSDLSSSDKYDTLFGFTKEEVNQVFSEQLEKTAKAHDLNRDECLERICSLYGGFSFSDRLIKVVCPVCVNHVMANGFKFLPYSSGGDYAFLRKSLENNNDAFDWLYDKDGQDPLYGDSIGLSPLGKELGTLLIQLGFATRDRVIRHDLEGFSTWRYRFTCPNEDMRRTLAILRAQKDPSYALKEIFF